MSDKKRRPNPHAFNTQVKILVDQHFAGDIEPAARALGVSANSLRSWVRGTRIPGFQRQTQTLRKLRSL